MLFSSLKEISSTPFPASCRPRSRLLPGLLAASLTVSGLAGCGSASETAPAPETSAYTSESITLSVYTWEDEISYVEDAANAYNALNHNVEIEVHPLTNNDYEDALAAALQDDSIHIDLFGAKSVSSVLTFREYTREITDEVLEAASTGAIDLASYGSMIDDVSYENSYFCLPTRTTCWVLYYNKTLFDAAGLDYPGQLTWEEYAELALQLTDVEGEDTVYGGYWVPWITNFLAIQHGSYLTDDSLYYAEESLKLLNRLYNEDQSHVSYDDMMSSEDPSNDSYQQFEAGRVAMMPQGEWTINILIEDDAQIDWGIAPMPVDEGVADGTTWGTYQYMCISSECEYSEEAFAFLLFLSGKEGAQIYAQDGIIPAYMDEEIQEIYLSAVGNSSASLFFEARRHPEQPSIEGYHEIQNAFYEQALLYLSGEQGLEETMSEFDLERREILSD